METSAALSQQLDGTERDYRTPGPALPRGGDPRSGCPGEQLRADFKAAAGQTLVKGFAVGRTLFGGASRAWLKHDIDDAQLVARIRDNYLQLIATVARARTWRRQ